MKRLRRARAVPPSFPGPSALSPPSPLAPQEPLQALVRALVRETEDALLVLSPAGLVEVWNPAATRLFGTPEDMALGQHVTSLLWGATDASASALPDTAALVAAGAAGPWRSLLALPQPAGEPLPYILRSSALPDGYGLLLAARELLLPPTSALESAERDTFYRLVGHELRTPATIASGFLQLLCHRVTEQAPALLTLAETSTRGMQRLLEVIDNLLLYSLLQRDQLELAPSPFDLTDALTDLAGLLSAREGREVLCPPAPAPCLVVADRARVTQLVTHLVRNALDYSPHNTPVVLVWGAAPITREAVIHVSDQGAGLSSFQQEALYDGVTAMGSPGNRGGLGLGLYLARALARAHGGESTLAQTGPAGSTFEARLPLAPAHPREGVTE